MYYRDAINRRRDEMAHELFVQRPVPDKILILAFKLKKNGDAKSALQQIKNKQYPEKYASHQKPIYLVGMSIDAQIATQHQPFKSRGANCSG